MKSLHFSRLSTKCTLNIQTVALLRQYSIPTADMHRHQKVCDKLDDLHEHVGSTEGYPTPAHLFCMLWNVKEDVHFESYYIYQDDGTFSKTLEKMQKKFKESWKICFFHCCKPVIMDPEC